MRTTLEMNCVSKVRARVKVREACEAADRARRSVNATDNLEENPEGDFARMEDSELQSE